MSHYGKKNETTAILINRREFIKKTAVGAGVAAATMTFPGFMMSRAGATGLANQPMKYKDYNVVFVSFDALQAAHVGSQGYPKMLPPP
jgi:hypothetical protein